jgi:DNA-binding helix-hairpin-helix protein with protein kinase domain
MADLIDDPTEVVDQRRWGLNNTIAVMVTVSAAFVALCNVKDGNIVQAMAQAQANSVDAWSYYQAKSTKQHFAEGTIDQITIQRDTTPGLSAEARTLLDRKIGEYAAKVKQYDAEKVKIKQAAEDFQHDYDKLNFRDDQFDMAEASLSLAIALLGVTALTQKRWLLAVSAIFASLGLVLGVSGFMGYNIHPNFIARLLG